MLFSAYAGLISRKLLIAEMAECMSLCMHHLDCSVCHMSNSLTAIELTMCRNSVVISCFSSGRMMHVTLTIFYVMCNIFT